MSFAYKRHEDAVMTVRPEHIRNAVCSSVTQCSMALAGQDALGVPVEVFYDDRTGDVRIVWIEDAGEGVRHRHDGVLTPDKQATRVLLLTDTGKARLARTCPSDGIQLVITQHRSRRVQETTASPEELKRARERRRNRKAELAKLRAAGLAPPPIPRTRGQIRVSERRTRGVSVTPVQ